MVGTVHQLDWRFLRAYAAACSGKQTAQESPKKVIVSSPLIEFLKQYSLIGRNSTPAGKNMKLELMPNWFLK